MIEVASRHELAANVLLCVAAVHALAALHHRLARGDGLLKRIRFATRKAPQRWE